MSHFDRFNDKFMPEPNSGCWLWIGGLRSNGYGEFWADGKRYQAHRWAYEHFIGPIPDGLPLDHLCRVRPCVNPDHLEPVTHKVNILRGEGPAAINARKTHCPRGHEYTNDNMYRHGSHRRCKTCLLSDGKARKQRIRDEAASRRADTVCCPGCGTVEGHGGPLAPRPSSPTALQKGFVSGNERKEPVSSPARIRPNGQRATLEMN